MNGNGNVSMSELQYGTSSSGVEEYLAELKAIAVEQAGQLVLDIDDITQACDNNWSGQAKENFKLNLANDAQHVSDQFSRLYSVLEDEIRAASSAMIEKDRVMLESDAYQAGAAVSSYANSVGNSIVDNAVAGAQNANNFVWGGASNALGTVGDYLQGTNTPLGAPVGAALNGAADTLDNVNAGLNAGAEWIGDQVGNGIDFITGQN